MKKREIRKFIVMIMGIILLVSEVQLFSGDNVYASTKTSKYEQLYVPSYAAMSGKMLYYAVGSGAQGGRLYMYNTSTKRQKKISDLRCTDLTITKKNIYCTVNKYIGSDARNRYVYRMSKDGKKTKVLAEGYSPVVVGKYIYYIGVKKGSAPWNANVKVEYGSTGIYRMDSNGRNKKCIYRFSGKVSTDKLIAGKNRVIFTGSNSVTYAIGTNGKMPRASISTSKNRISTFTWLTSSTINKLPISNNKYGYIYKIQGAALVRCKGTSRRTIFKVPAQYVRNGGINYVIDCGDYLFVVSGYTYAFVVSKSGAGVKNVAAALIGY